MPIAKTVTEALDLLKSSVSEPVQDPEAGTEGDAPVAEPNAIDVDIIKAEKIELLEKQIANGDDFLVGLAQHQEQNVEKLSKGLEGTMNATHAVLNFIKGFADKLDNLSAAVEKLSDTPQPRRSVLTKAEAVGAAAGIVKNNEEGVQEPLQKGEMSSALLKAYKEGKCLDKDVTIMETALGGGAFSMENIPLEVVYSKLSDGGKAVIKELIESR
jgi:hypothetical protein